MFSFKVFALRGESLALTVHRCFTAARHPSARLDVYFSLAVISFISRWKFPRRHCMRSVRSFRFGSCNSDTSTSVPRSTRLYWYIKPSWYPDFMSSDLPPSRPVISPPPAAARPLVSRRSSGHERLSLAPLPSISGALSSRSQQPFSQHSPIV